MIICVMALQENLNKLFLLYTEIFGTDQVVLVIFSLICKRCSQDIQVSTDGVNHVSRPTDS